MTGTKVWTSGAHEADAFFALARIGAARPGPPARGPEPVHRRPARAGRDDPPDHLDGRGAPLQRGAPRRGVHPRRPGARGGRRRLGAGDLRARLRAQRPRAGPLDVPAARRPPRRRWTTGGCPPTPASGGTSPASLALQQMSFAVSHGLEAHEHADTPRPWSRCSARPRRATSPTIVDTLTASGWALRRRARHAAARGDPAAAGLHPARRHQRDPARRHRPRAGDALMTDRLVRFAASNIADRDLVGVLNDLFTDYRGIARHAHGGGRPRPRTCGSGSRSSG